MYKINKTATLNKYILENYNNKAKPAIIILAGGAYLYVSKRERYPSALMFLNAGINSFTLDYTTYDKNPNTNLELMVNEVKQSYDYIIKNSKKFNIDINKIYLIGYSAGGHLALEFVNRYPNLINKLILSYPALEINKIANPKTKEEKFINNIFSYNPINNINKKHPHVFIWHTTEDELVPIKSSINYISKLNQLNIGFEAHFYEKGIHGYSVATDLVKKDNLNKIPNQVSTWTNMCINWLKQNDQNT